MPQDGLAPCFASERLEVIATFIQREIANTPMQIIDELIVFLEIVSRAKLGLPEHGQICRLKKAEDICGVGWITLLIKPGQLHSSERPCKNSDCFTEPTRVD